MKTILESRFLHYMHTYSKTRNRVIPAIMFLLILPYLGFSQYWDTNGNTVAAGKNKLGTINDLSKALV